MCYVAAVEWMVIWLFFKGHIIYKRFVYLANSIQIVTFYTAHRFLHESQPIVARRPTNVYQLRLGKKSKFPTTDFTCAE